MTREELAAALRKADAAGNADDARRLAGAIRQLDAGPAVQAPARPAMDPLHMVNPAARAQVQANQPMRSLPMSPLGPGNERYAPPKPPPQGDPLAPANPQAAAANVDAQQRARGLVPYTNASTGETYWRPDPARQVADANAQFRAREAAKASAAQAQAENEAFRNSRPEIVNQASDAIRGGFAATENAAFDAVDAGLDAVDPRRKVSQFISQNITPAAEQVGRGIGDFVEGPSGRFGGMAGPAVGAITGGLSELGATMARDPQDASTQIVDALEPTHMLARGGNTAGDALDAAMGGDFGRSGNLMAQAVPDLIGGSGVLPAMSVTANALRTAARAPQRELAEQLARIQPLPATGRVPMAAPRAAASVGGAGGPPPAAPAAPALPVPVRPQTAQQAPTQPQTATAPPVPPIPPNAPAVTAGAAQPVPARSRAEQRADDLLIKKLAADGITMDDVRKIQARLARRGDSGVYETIGEIAALTDKSSGANLRGLQMAGGAAPGPLQEALVGLVNQNTEKLSPRLSRGATRATGQKADNAVATLDELETRLRTEATPAYDDAYATPVNPQVFANEILPVLNTPSGQKALQAARNNLASIAADLQGRAARGASERAMMESQRAQAAVKSIDDFMADPVRGTAIPTTMALDYTKRAFDDVIADAGFGSDTARIVGGTKRNFADSVSQATGGQYGNALGVFEDVKRLEDAFEVGTQALNKKTWELERELAKGRGGSPWTAGEVEALAMGVARNIEDLIEANNQSALTKLLKDKALKNMATALGSQKAADMFEETIRRLGANREWGRRVAGGSDTAMRQAAIRDAGMEGEDAITRVLDRVETSGNQFSLPGLVNDVAVKPIARTAKDIYQRLRYPGVYDEEVNRALIPLIGKPMTEGNLNEVIRRVEARMAEKGLIPPAQPAAVAAPPPAPRRRPRGPRGNPPGTTSSASATGTGIVAGGVLGAMAPADDENEQFINALFTAAGVGTAAGVAAKLSKGGKPPPASGKVAKPKAPPSAPRSGPPGVKPPPVKMGFGGGDRPKVVSLQDTQRERFANKIRDVMASTPQRVADEKRAYHSSGRLPLPIGTRMRAPKFSNGDLAKKMNGWVIEDYFITPMKPDEYGYVLKRGDETLKLYASSTGNPYTKATRPQGWEALVGPDGATKYQEALYRPAKTAQPKAANDTHDAAAAQAEWDALFRNEGDPPTQNGLPGGSRDLPMDEGSRMERAKAQGFDTGRVAYRGLNRSYDEGGGGRRYQMFTSSESDAAEYGSNVVAAYLRKGNNLQVDGGRRNFNSVSVSQLPDDVRAKLHPSIQGVARIDDIADAAQKAGYDSVSVSNVYDNSWGEIPTQPTKPTKPRVRTQKDIDLDNELVRELGFDPADFPSTPRTPDAPDVPTKNTDPVTIDVVFDTKNIRSKDAAFDPSQEQSSKLLAGMGGSSRGIADNLKQDAALAAFGSAGGSFANQDDPQAGALGGMGLALGGKYVPRAVNALRGAGRVKPPPMRGAAQGKFRGPNNQTFAGVNAKTADKVALARAQNMEAEGASREEIIDATGWFKQHGQWKFEIIDSGAKLTGNKSGPLGSVMEHPELYKAYPDLAELNTTRTPWKTGGDYIAPSVFNDEMIRVGNVGDDARSIALHEAGGHGVQRRENFPSGASSKLSVAEHRQALSDDLEDTKYWLERHRSEGATASEIRAAEDRVAQLEAQFDATRNLTPTQFYRNTAGEVEARNVQKRDEIRRRGKNPGRPWETQDVPDDQQIVRFGSGKAESRPKPPPKGQTGNALAGKPPKGPPGTLSRMVAGGAIGGIAGGVAGEAEPQTPETAQKIADNKSQLDSLLADIKTLEADKAFFRDAETIEAQKRLKKEGIDIGNSGPNRDGVDGINKGLTQKGIAEFKAQIEADLNTAYNRRTQLEGVAEKLKQDAAFERTRPTDEQQQFRDFAPLIGGAVGAVLGKSIRIGGSMYSKAAAKPIIKKLDALLSNAPIAKPKTAAQRAAVESEIDRRASNLNEFWREGGADTPRGLKERVGMKPTRGVPFASKGNGEWTARAPKNVMKPSELFPDRFIGRNVGPMDALVGGAGATEAYLADQNAQRVKEQLNTAYKTAKDDPSEKNLARVQELEDQYALSKGWAMLGTGLAVGTGIGVFTSKYARKRGSVQTAEEELAILRRAIADLKKQAGSAPKTPKPVVATPPPPPAPATPPLPPARPRAPRRPPTP